MIYILIQGEESKFSVVCRSFSELFEDEFDSEKSTNFTSEDMTSFFCSFASEGEIHVATDNAKKQNLNDLFNDVSF